MGIFDRNQSPTGFDTSIPQVDLLQGLQSIGNQPKPDYSIPNLAIGGNGAGVTPGDTYIPQTSFDPKNVSYGFGNITGANGETVQQGLFSPIMDGLTGVFNIYAGLKALGQQEDALGFQKDAFNKNFAASKSAFQERLRGNYGRKAALGGNKGQTEDQYVEERSNFG